MMDELATRAKSYELAGTRERFPNVNPVYVRIDGRSFSKFTSRFNKPFDELMSGLMETVARHLLEMTDARCAFTQSDEISLLFLGKEQDDGSRSDILFGGRGFKMTSVLAAMATARFMAGALEIWPEHARTFLPHFDARVYDLPGLDAAADTILWRYLDGRRNAISSIAREYFSHKALHRKGVRQMISMLEETGVDIDCVDPRHRHGCFFVRKMKLRDPDDPSFAHIPPAYRPTEPVVRSAVERVVVPDFDLISNPVSFLFDGDDIRRTRKTTSSSEAR